MELQNEKFGRCPTCDQYKELLPSEVGKQRIFVKSQYEQKPRMIETSRRYCRTCLVKYGFNKPMSESLFGQEETSAKLGDDLESISKRNFGRYTPPEIERQIVVRKAEVQELNPQAMIENMKREARQAPKRIETATRNYERWNVPVCFVSKKCVEK